jgi:hypothetical protein
MFHISIQALRIIGDRWLRSVILRADPLLNICNWIEMSKWRKKQEQHEQHEQHEQEQRRARRRQLAYMKLMYPKPKPSQPSCCVQ